MKRSGKPRVSVLVPAMLGYDSVRTAIDAWQAQSRRSELELMILCPDHLLPSAEEQLRAEQAGVILLPIGRRDLHEARHMGIHLAAGGYIMLAEDHCLPEPGFAEALIRKLEEGWDAVGPALRAGGRGSAWATASFLLGYGEWLAPLEAGRTNVLCGHNGTIRKGLLLAAEPELEEDLIMAAFLSRKLIARGCTAALDPLQRMRHYDPPGAWKEVVTMRVVGTTYGAIRTKEWSLIGRLAYGFAWPLIGVLHFRRALRHFLRAGRPYHGYGWDVLGATAGLAMVWGIGESIGAVIGLKRAVVNQWKAETKPPSPADVARADAWERASGRMAPDMVEWASSPAATAKR